MNVCVQFYGNPVVVEKFQEKRTSPESVEFIHWGP